MAKSLYGGEAMTTNQTIDGVPREYVLRLTHEAHSVLLGMVEHCLNIRACMGMDEGYKDFVNERDEHDFVKELRALLDKEVSGDSRAPLPQGEPVALPKVLPLDDPRCPRHHLIADGFRSGADWMRREVEKLGPLYAKQPAPVAVVLPERKSVNTHNSHDWDEGHADGWVAYDTELKRLNPSL
ncbi:MULTISPECIES: hypothetical protein [Pseudomonas]|uniref:hypothetical protein n=1 Tax=Pseudomonas TaxID=286 RepID=UPI00110C8678|nr:MULTISPECIES: hypothetical protein [Pseudomonas]